ncbi:MAG TPA: serine/threonine-protein kinase [Candidatus Limnocylindrales bacterium]|jgi:serine/threonine protein kinase|nr:serine/threonine-protein kinase [Candidatus Limnocylindrales bacterium]
MTRLTDNVIARLQTEMAVPDLAGTRYQPIKMLGSGGMATVWLVRDTVLQREVAMKVLAPEASGGDLASRLQREAQLLARLEHPGIVPVHDAGTLVDGRTFYCMKYVQGRTLDEFVQELGLRERLELLRRLAEPVAFAHARGFVHRDLKPGNIMIGAFGEVLVMDWGLAKSLQERAGFAEPAGGQTIRELETAKTAHGTVLGTRGFMSPEQESGDQQEVDERSDIFALGAILRLLLADAGEQPSRALRAIAEKAMSADKTLRYRSVLEFTADIGRYLLGEPVAAYPETLMERSLRQLRKHQVAVVLVLVYLLMRLAFILFSK